VWEGETEDINQQTELIEAEKEIERGDYSTLEEFDKESGQWE
jgi:hypothetical protein